MVAGGVGVINGVFIAYVGIASFVVTLGMLFFLDGLTLISHAEQIRCPAQDDRHQDVCQDLRRRHLLGVHLGGRHRRGPADNASHHTLGDLHGCDRREQARRGRSRHHVRCVLIRNFILCAFFAGLWAFSRASGPAASIRIQRLPGFLLYAIAAVIIGGTLMTGGEGTVVGALIGALFIGVLEEGLVLKSVRPTTSTCSSGSRCIIAMVINVWYSA